MGEREDAESRYAEKLELVFATYERVLDLDIALTIVPLSEADKIKLIDDPDLAARIAVCDAKVREDLMLDLRNLAKNAESEGVKLTALKELGKTVYPRRFRDDTGGAKQMPRSIKYEVMEPLE